MTDIPPNATPTDYWEIAYKAIKEGFITKDEALTICRPGTRKSGYWERHLLDLNSLIKDRKHEKLQRKT